MTFKEWNRLIRGTEAESRIEAIARKAEAEREFDLDTAWDAYQVFKAAKEIGHRQLILMNMDKNSLSL